MNSSVTVQMESSGRPSGRVAGGALLQPGQRQSEESWRDRRVLVEAEKTDSTICGIVDYRRSMGGS